MKNYALVIPVNGAINGSCQEAWQLLETQYNVKHISSRCPFPHLTLFAGSTDHPECEVVSAWQTGVARGAFDLKANGLGVFLFDLPTLYIRWLLTEPLAALYTSAKTIYSPICSSSAFSTQPEYWVPKTTLAGFDTSVEELSKILINLKGIDFYQEMSVTELAVLEYDEEGERVVSSFRL